MSHKIYRTKPVNSFSTPVLIRVLVFAVFIGVLIICQYSIIADNDLFFLYPTVNRKIYDYFLYGKEFYYLILSLITIPYSIFRLVLLKNRTFLLGLCFLVLGIISVSFTQYSKFVLWGAPDNYQGLYAIIAYALIYIFGLVLSEDESINNLLRKSVMVIIGIITFLGFIETFYKPVLQIPLVKKIAGVTINLVSSSKGLTVTFYNPNYLSVFVVLLIPIVIGTIINAKSIKSTVISSIVLCCSIVLLTLTGSTAGFVVGSLELSFIAILCIAQKKSLFPNGIILISCLVVFVVLALIMGNAGNSDSYKSVNCYPLKYIQIEDDRLSFGSCDTSYVLTLSSGNSVGVVLNDGEGVITDSNDTIMIHDDESDSDINISVYGRIVSIDFGYKSAVKFNYINNRIGYVAQNDKILYELTPSEFNDSKISAIYRVATGRGYIWVNSIPVVLSSPVVGHGPGSYVFEFNQYDIPGMLTTHGTTSLIVDKPHSLYIEIASTLGIPSLLLILFSFGFYILSFVKHLRTKSVVGGDSFDVCLGLSVLGFMLISTVNDSSITVTPVFCLLFGYSLGRLTCKNTKE